MSRRAPSTTTGERMAALIAEDSSALASALAQAPADPRGVHEARKAVRRLRSLLALARQAVGEPARELDQQLRGLAKGLSELRDAQVVRETAAAIARTEKDPHDAANWQHIVHALERDQACLMGATLDKDPGFVRRQTLAHRCAEQLERLPWQQVHATGLRDALKKSYRRQQRVQHAALDSGDADDLHDWRRKSRRLRMQLHAMKKLGVPARLHSQKVSRASARHIAGLVDQLGALQDLELLHEALRTLEHAQQAATTHLPRRRLRAADPVLPLS